MQQEPFIQQQPYQPQVVTTVTTTTTPGAWIEPTKDVPEPALVLLLGFIFPGLGQIIIGQQSKGVSHIITYIVGWCIIAMLTAFLLVGIYCVPVMFVWDIFVAIDAFQIAQRLKQGIPVMDGECGNRLAMFGAGFTGAQFVFNNQDKNMWPAEYELRMRQFNL